MSVKAKTAPRPPGVSIGADHHAIGNIDPSRRTNQSSSLCTVSPVWRGRNIGHSASG
jgi:hypothetical protein